MNKVDKGDRSRAPLHLWMHVVAVAGAAAVLVPKPTGGWLWLLLIGMGVILWQLLTGSRFAWWIQLVGTAGGLLGLYEAHQRVRRSELDLSIFFDQSRVGAAGILLGLSAILLVLPTTLRYARRGPSAELSPVGKIAFVLAAAFVSSVPVSVLSAEERLPSEGLLDNARGGVLLAGDEREPIALYAKETSDRVCLVSVEPSGSSMSCDDRSHNPPTIGSVDDDYFGIVGTNVARVEIIESDQLSHTAILIDDPRFQARFYYLLGGPDDGERAAVIGYDAEGNELFRQDV